MHRHDRFDLWLHDDDELAAVLSSAPVTRTTIHEWALSCVQRVRTGDGANHIYKAAAPPTIEPAVYARARSPLLVPVRVLPARDSTTFLVMDEVTAPRLCDRHLDEAEAVATAQTLVEQIAAIAGDPPSLGDIRGEQRWAAYFGETLRDLAGLVDGGGFAPVDRGTLRALERIAAGAAVREAVTSPSGFIHTDLMGDNVLVGPDGFLVLDWQRPLHGPRALDAATLLDSLGFAPLRHLPLGIVQLRLLLLVSWFTASATRWLPAGIPRSGRTIAHLTRELLDLPGT